MHLGGFPGNPLSTVTDGATNLPTLAIGYANVPILAIGVGVPEGIIADVRISIPALWVVHVAQAADVLWIRAGKPPQRTPVIPRPKVIQPRFGISLLAGKLARV
jgi:hypothetical protein